VRPRFLGRMRRAATAKMRTWQTGALILLYHRVADVEFDPQLLCVSERHFEEQLKVLAAKVGLLNLQGLVAALRDRTLSQRATVLTFDDGYADNLHAARPLLEKHRVPATVFVSTDHLNNKKGYWWDRLEELLLWPGELPPMLEVRLGDAAPRWDLGRAARYDEAAFRRYRDWTVLSGDDPTPRHSAYRELHRLLWQLGPAEHRAVLAQIAACRQPLPHVGEPPRGMDATELVVLTAGGLVEVGAHTVTHPRLARLTVEEQCAEIRRSKQELEAVLGRAVTSFAYPFGSREDYTTDTIALVRDAGLTCACANVPGVVRPGSNVFELPRMIVRNWSGSEFASRLEEWFLEP
jgi:peptidoglycan/xylan/chitin deacetylase (PgdA/CDA1 family)